MRILFGSLVMCSISTYSAAAAQGFTDNWEFDGKAEAVIVGSTADNTERLPAQSVLGELSVRATAEKTLENSAEIGFRFEAKAQKDNPARAGFTGNIEPFGPSAILPLVAIPPQQRGAFSGLVRTGTLEDTDFIGSIETASIYLDGGYGQISAGLGRGVAARFQEGVPDVFTHARAANPKLDPAGLNVIRTENDLTGPAAKITYQTPRILGLRAGLSYTPDANASGVDRDPSRSVAGVTSSDIENVIEASAQFSRKLTKQNLRIRASASYAIGDVTATTLNNSHDDVEVWGGGLEFEFDTLSFGAEYLYSNNGFQQGGDYTSWSIGATKEAFGWDWGIRYGQAEDESVAVEGENWSIGGATNISQNIRIAAGYQSNDVEFGPLPLTNPQSGDINSPDGIVVEVTLSH